MTRGHKTLVLASCLAAASCAGPPTPDGPSPSLRDDIELAREFDVIESRVPARATLATLLRAHAIDATIVQRIVDATRVAFDPRRLRAEQPYRLELTLDGLLRSFVYRIDADRFLRIESEPATPSSPEPGFDVAVVPYEQATQLVSIHGTIDRDHPSLIAALVERSEGIALAIELSEIFGGEVDFNNDLQPGDSLDVVFEKVLTDGEFARYGSILAAELHNEGRTLKAFRFQPPGSEPGYYDEDGRSLKRFFLRSPLKFEPRISSGFSYRRLHPVLGQWRSHPAIDYVAPIGAPVVAVSNGVVTTAGRAGGAGIMVSVRHNNGYESSYLHLSAIAAGVRPGARVTQGSMIGRVGRTGLATGPHLDYRLKKDGTWVNPLVEHKKLPPGEPIAAAHHATFVAERDRVQALYPGSMAPAEAVAQAAIPAGDAPASPTGQPQ